VCVCVCAEVLKWCHDIVCVCVQCYSERGIWMVGLISASVSTLLVLLMCMHFILRVRAAAHQQRQPSVVRFGTTPPVGASAVQAREIMARFLETFPTFKYDVSALCGIQDGSALYAFYRGQTHTTKYNMSTYILSQIFSTSLTNKYGTTHDSCRMSYCLGLVVP